MGSTAPARRVWTQRLRKTKLNPKYKSILSGQIPVIRCTLYLLAAHGEEWEAIAQTKAIVRMPL
jgi:hypothetical protein